MPIVDLQRGIAEAGRIRIGQKVPSRNGSRPAKLDTFRLTSADRRRIDQAAEAYGGAVSEWEAPAGKQWQVITETDVLEVIVPPSDLSFSQHYELWSAGGCQRRCDGVTEQLRQAACLCDPEARECEVHTRLSVLLRDLQGLGVWRLDTQGWYAARELASAVEIIQLASGRGALLPARLRLDQRSVKRPGANGKPETRRFAVPVLDVEISPAQLLAGGARPIPLEQAATPPLTPVPQLPTAEGPSIAEQSAPPAARASRANAAAELPASGRSRRSRATEQPEQDETRDAPPSSQEAPAPATQPEAGDSPPVAAPPADRPPVDVMVDLIKAAGKDPDEIRERLGYQRWADAPEDVVARLTEKAREALMDQAEDVATAPTEPDPEPTKKPARSRAKKES